MYFKVNDGININDRKTCNPEREFHTHSGGWTVGKIKELEEIFEKFSYDEIGELLPYFGIIFLKPIKTISKLEIVQTIADDWTYEKMKVEIEIFLKEQKDTI